MLTCASKNTGPRGKENGSSDFQVIVDSTLTQHQPMWFPQQLYSWMATQRNGACELCVLAQSDSNAYN